MTAESFALLRQSIRRSSGRKPTKQEAEALLDSLEEQLGALEDLRRIALDYRYSDEFLGIVARRRLGGPVYPGGDSSAASRPVGTVKDGVLHWTDADGVEHSGPFIEPEDRRK